MPGLGGPCPEPAPCQFCHILCHSKLQGQPRLRGKGVDFISWWEKRRLCWEQSLVTIFGDYHKVRLWRFQNYSLWASSGYESFRIACSWSSWEYSLAAVRGKYVYTLLASVWFKLSSSCKEGESNDRKGVFAANYFVLNSGQRGFLLIVLIEDVTFLTSKTLLCFT